MLKEERDPLLGILDAKCPESWEIGFENGVKFALNILQMQVRNILYDLKTTKSTRKTETDTACNNQWELLANEMARVCRYFREKHHP